MAHIERVQIGHPTRLPQRITGRDGLEGAKRLVVKIGSSSLTLDDGQLDRNAIWRLSASVARLVHSGRQVVIVSSGAIAAALRPTGLSARPTATATSQALASIGQGLLIAAWSQACGEHGVKVGQVLLTEDDLADPQKYQNVRAAMEELLSFGVVPIVNENDTVATRELRFGDNDRLASLVSQVIGADALALLTDVDGLMTKPPGHEGAERISIVKDAAKLKGVQIGARGSSVGTGGMVTKLSAAHDASITGTATVLGRPQNFDALLGGEDRGTFFPAHASGKRRSRLMWLKFATRGEGDVVVDEGAEAALLRSSSSLLPVGITAVHGTFEAGGPIDVLGTGGRVLARGLSHFSSAQLREVAGKSSEDIASVLGPDAPHVAIHRDDMVVLASPES